MRAPFGEFSKNVSDKINFRDFFRHPHGLHENQSDNMESRLNWLSRPIEKIQSLAKELKHRPCGLIPTFKIVHVENLENRRFYWIDCLVPNNKFKLKCFIWLAPFEIHSQRCIYHNSIFLECILLLWSVLCISISPQQSTAYHYNIVHLKIAAEPWTVWLLLLLLFLFLSPSVHSMDSPPFIIPHEHMHTIGNR